MNLSFSGDRITIQPNNDSWWHLLDTNYGWGSSAVFELWQRPSDRSQLGETIKVHCLMRHNKYPELYYIVMSGYEDFFEHDDSHDWENCTMIYDFMKTNKEHKAFMKKDKTDK